jgi:raffinose/stachyose/melibiose transport system permease protein
MNNENVLRKILSWIIIVFGLILFAIPIVFIFINSFKSQFFIDSSFFSLPDFDSFVGLENYFAAIIRTDILQAFVISFIICAAATFFIIYFSSMAAWMIVRTKNILTRLLYIFFIFSMAIPFESVLFTIPQLLKVFQLNNILGAIIIYIGFAIPINVFVYSLFIKQSPKSIEEAAFMDGCSFFGVFFKIVLPSLKPVSVALALLNFVWVWNNFLIADIVLSSNFKTVAMVIEAVGSGAYRNSAILVVVLLICLVACFIFYRLYNKYIVKKIENIK